MRRLTLSPKMKVWVLTTARFLIGVLFFYSGLSKLVQPNEYFQIAIGLYQLVPERLIPLVSHTVPWIELLASAYLLLGYRTGLAAGALAGLTGLFQLVIGQALLRQLPVDECGCFGGGFIHLTLYQSFALDTLLLLALIQIASAQKHRWALDNRF